MLLKIENATKRFGGVAANENVSLEIEEGQIVGLIGPNGAGKSTLFKSINGFNRLDEGEIYFKGEPISKMETYKVAQLGITCTFQHAQLFQNIDLEESVLVGAYNKRKNKKEALEYAHKMLKFVDLYEKKNNKVSSLNMYERKKAELAASLASEPKLILLDELFAGLVPNEVDLLVDYVRRVNEELDISIFIVEHVLKAIMTLCDNIYVLEHGKLIASGNPKEITNNPAVIKAYLGGDDDDVVS